MPPSTAVKPRARQRLVRHAVVAYNTVERRPTGEAIEVPHTALRGEVITIEAVEEAKLDSMGALAVVGQTVADLDAEDEARIEAYRQGRLNATGGQETW